MFKKILIASLSVLVVAGGIAGLSAFEAHVINVTAKIENALEVSSEEIDFGTVFPQEYLAEPLTIRLSDSFMAEERVDDVDYIIRQKPKCGWTIMKGTVLIGDTRTGEVLIDENGEPYVSCEPEPQEPPVVPAEYPQQEVPVWGELPSLCQYISKTPDMAPEPGNDTAMPSFHQPYKVIGDSPNYELVWNDTYGRLSKLEGDTADEWLIDLAVPCFGDYCAQDWEEWVKSINEAAEPSMYTQPIANEHKIFGCDLWVEVGAISRVVNLENKDANWDIIPGDGIEGKVSYNKRGSSFKGVVVAQGLKSNSQYQLTINGPGGGGVGVGSTNDLIAGSACDAGNQYCGGWWTGSQPIVCQLGGSAGWEGFYVFDLISCSGTATKAVTDSMGNLYYEFDVGLRAGAYSGVKFLIKESFSPWQGVMFETEPLDFVIE